MGHVTGSGSAASVFLQIFDFSHPLWCVLKCCLALSEAGQRRIVQCTLIVRTKVLPSLYEPFIAHHLGRLFCRVYVFDWPALDGNIILIVFYE